MCSRHFVSRKSSLYRDICGIHDAATHLKKLLTCENQKTVTLLVTKHQTTPSKSDVVPRRSLIADQLTLIASDLLIGPAEVLIDDSLVHPARVIEVSVHREVVSRVRTKRDLRVFGQFAPEAG